ncbi:glycosyltransferase [Sporomusa paucivorans]|uniref:glycosyltransferase n=1 Tax=Sporomusa paucivorans TaxID=2376 RepID=UPI0035710640
MKIKVLTRYPWSVVYGGAEIQAQKYVEYVSKQGIDISFLDLHNIEEKYEILHIVGMNYATKNIINYAHLKNIKVILSPVFFYDDKMKRLAKLYMTLLNFIDGGRAREILCRDALDLADVILPNSISELNQIKYLYGIKDSKKFKVIYNGIDFVKQEDVSPTLFKNIYNIKSEYILSVGMIDERKNTLNLIKGFLLSKIKVPLVIIGDFRTESEEYKKEVISLFNRHSEKIMHIPFIDDRNIIYSAYKGALFHAMPSRLETPGLSNLEAVSLGCNVLVGDCPPIREYLNDIPYYVDHKDVNDIAKSMLKIVNEKRTIRNEVVSQYYWSSIAKNLVDVYSKL